MTNSSDLDGIKHLLSLIVQQVDALTTQTTELMPLKTVTADYRAEEKKAAASLTARMSTLRQLAKTTLDTLD